MYAAEDGEIKSKAQLLEEIRPFPQELRRRIRLTHFQTKLHGTTAITNYIIEEDEGYFGQVIHARYLSTDEWMLSAGD